MKRMLRRGNSGTYIYVICIGCLFLLWRAGDAVNSRLNRLTVREVGNVQIKDASPAAVNFYPVVVKHRIALEAERAAQGAQADRPEIDALFRDREERKPDLAPPRPIEPDFVALASSQIRLDATMDNGAILNGRFYRIGEEMHDLSLVGTNGSAVVPILATVTATGVTVLVGRKSATFKLPH